MEGSTRHSSAPSALLALDAEGVGAGAGDVAGTGVAGLGACAAAPNATNAATSPAIDSFKVDS